MVVAALMTFSTTRRNMYTTFPFLQPSLSPKDEDAIDDTVGSARESSVAALTPASVLLSICKRMAHHATEENRVPRMHQEMTAVNASLELFITTKLWRSGLPDGGRTWTACFERQRGSREARRAPRPRAPSTTLRSRIRSGRSARALARTHIDVFV